jgi:anti-anti-sigma factor
VAPRKSRRQTQRLDLVGSVTIYGAAELRRQFEDALADAAARRTALCVDLSSVAEIDSAGLQLLVSLSRSAVKVGVALVWEAPSAAVGELLQVYRLQLDAPPFSGKPA